MMLSRFAMFFGGGRGRDREGGNPLALLATLMLAPVAAMLIQAAISRSREYDADAGGAPIAGGPHGLVSALRKIECGLACRPARREPRYRAHVHRQAVFRRGVAGAFQHAPAN